MSEVRKTILHPQGEQNVDLYPKTNVEQVVGLSEELDNRATVGTVANMISDNNVTLYGNPLPLSIAIRRIQFRDVPTTIAGVSKSWIEFLVAENGILDGTPSYDVITSQQLLRNPLSIQGHLFKSGVGVGFMYNFNVLSDNPYGIAFDVIFPDGSVYTNQWFKIQNIHINNRCLTVIEKDV